MAKAESSYDEEMSAENLNEERKIMQKAQETGVKVRHWLSDQSHRVNDVKNQAEKNIKRHPFVSTSVAFAAGVLISALFNNRK